MKLNSIYKGENEEMEIRSIRKFFPTANQIIRIDSKNKFFNKEQIRLLQINGIDYIIKFPNKVITVDTKIHSYDSDLLLLEYKDTRPNYENREWTKHTKTDYLIWIEPYFNKAYLYNFQDITNIINKPYLKDYFKESLSTYGKLDTNFLRVKHYGTTGETFNLPITHFGKESDSLYKIGELRPKVEINTDFKVKNGKLNIINSNSILY